MDTKVTLTAVPWHFYQDTLMAGVRLGSSDTHRGILAESNQSCTTAIALLWWLRDAALGRETMLHMVYQQLLERALRESTV